MRGVLSQFLFVALSVAILASCTDSLSLNVERKLTALDTTVIVPPVDTIPKDTTKKGDTVRVDTSKKGGEDPKVRSRFAEMTLDSVKIIEFFHGNPPKKRYLASWETLKDVVIAKLDTTVFPARLWLHGVFAPISRDIIKDSTDYEPMDLPLAVKMNADSLRLQNFWDRLELAPPAPNSSAIIIEEKNTQNRITYNGAIWLKIREIVPPNASNQTKGIVILQFVTEVPIHPNNSSITVRGDLFFHF